MRSSQSEVDLVMHHKYSKPGIPFNILMIYKSETSQAPTRLIVKPVRADSLLPIPGVGRQNGHHGAL